MNDVAPFSIVAAVPIAPVSFPQAPPCKAGFPCPGGGGRLAVFMDGQPAIVQRPTLGCHYPRGIVGINEQEVVDHPILLSDTDDDEAGNDSFDEFYSREVCFMNAREGCAMTTSKRVENLGPPKKTAAGKENSQRQFPMMARSMPLPPALLAAPVAAAPAPVVVELSVPTYNGVSIGICGGMGPMAGCMLHQIIIANTIAAGDQDHVDVIHLSTSTRVPDRTAYLQGKIEQNPGEIVATVARNIGNCAAQSSNKVVCGAPCNTFHSPQIWSEFVRQLEDQPNVEVVNMLEETAKLVKDLCPGARKIGLMSTTGTRSTGVYNTVLEPFGFSVLEVPEAQQDELHDAIYNPEWGIKAVSPVTPQARGKCVAYVKMLVEQGAEAIILGCTEFPLALPEKSMRGVPLVNPMVALGRALVAAAAPKKLKPLQ